MMKKILCLLLAVAMLAFLPVLGGCEEKEGDRISVEKRTTIENQPAGQRIKTTGD